MFKIIIQVGHAIALTFLVASSVQAVERAKPFAQFDPEVTKLPAGYNGTDSKLFLKAFGEFAEDISDFKIFSKLAPKAEITKDEFENNEQYEARKTLLRSKSPIQLGALYAFSYEPIIKYDAEKSLLKVNLYTQYRRGDDLHVMLMNVSNSHKEYLGVNSYGATARVSKDEHEYLFLSQEKNSLFKKVYEPQLEDEGNTYSNNYMLPLSKQVDANTAKEWKKNGLSALLVGDVKQWRINMIFTISRKATITTPDEIRRVDWGIPFDIKYIFLYLKKTGQIVEKIDVSTIPIPLPKKRQAF